jgi:thymidylate synthase (FAD)
MNSVKLIGVTKPTLKVEDDLNMSAEGLIAYCARVSNPPNQDNPDSERLLKYLVKNKHWSPFEMVNVVMEIETTRDIARQILRHRSFSFQEFSQRYAAVTEMSKPREARLQDQKNRQNSIETDNLGLAFDWITVQNDLMRDAQNAYEWALENGIAKEVARSVLPEGLTMSRMYMSGTLRSWIHYVDLRTGNGTQKEHREIAEACKAILMKEFPFLEALWGEDGYIPFA